MKKVTDLGYNEVIHCPTEAEAIAICQLMHDAGLRWLNGKSYLEDTNFLKDICYIPKSGTFTLDGCLAYGDIIYPASAFLPADFYKVAEAHSSVVIDPVKNDVMMVSDPTQPSPELLDAYNLLSSEGKKEMREKYPDIKWPDQMKYVSQWNASNGGYVQFGLGTSSPEIPYSVRWSKYCTPEIDHEKREIRFVKNG